MCLTLLRKYRVMKLKVPVLFFLLLFAGACSSKKQDVKEVEIPDDAPTYFSIRQFIKDQWESYKLQPYTLERVITSGDKKDSSMVSAYEFELGEIMETFIKTDIGDKKFLGKYDFNMVEDLASFTRSYYYEANAPDVYTKKLHIITDAENNKIKNIYIEAEEKGGATVKLYYAPIKLIRIQEISKPTLGSKKEITKEYRFPVSGDQE